MTKDVQPFWQLSLGKTILWSFLFVTVFAAVVWFFFLVPYTTAQHWIEKLPSLSAELIEEYYPEDLVITVEDGNLSINQPSPYCLVLFEHETARFGVLFDAEADLNAITTQQNSSEYENLCTPVAYLTTTHLITHDEEKDSWEIQKIPVDTNFILAQPQFIAMAHEYVPMIASAGKTIYYLVPFVVAPFIFVFVLIINLWYALVLYVILKVAKLKKHLTFAYAYSISLISALIWGSVQTILLQATLSKGTDVTDQSALWNNTSPMAELFNIPFLGTAIITLLSIGLTVYWIKPKERHKTIGEMYPELSTTPINNNPVEKKTSLPQPTQTIDKVDRPIPGNHFNKSD